MSLQNQKKLFAYLGLLGVILWAGTYQPPSHRHAEPDTLVRRDFAVMSWTDGTVRGHIEVERRDARPTGYTHLHYQVLRRGDGKVLAYGRGYIPNETLSWGYPNGLRLKIDTRKIPIEKRKGPSGEIDLKWRVHERAPGAEEDSSVSVEGKVLHFDLKKVTSAVLE